MATQLRRSVVATLVALLTLLIAHWFDSGVLTDVQLRAAHPGLLFNFGPVAHMLTAVGVVVLALTAWWSRSLLVGACYALVGGFLVLLPAMYWAFDSVTYIYSMPGMQFPVPVHTLFAPPQIAPDAIVRPSIVPQPIASMLGDWYSTVSTGVTGAVFTLAAAMLVSGVVVVGSVLRAHRRGVTGASPAAAQAPQ